MKYQSLEIRQCGSPEDVNRCVLPGHCTLAEVQQQVNLEELPYVLVENEYGDLIGIVESALIKRRLSASNKMERQRWLDMELASALQWKISPTTPRLQPSTAYQSVPISCTAVSSPEGVMALVSDKDVFVSWHAVRESLSEAMIDPVSMLPNRLVFDRRLAEEIGRTRREGRSIAVVLYDVDHFKEVNDSYGHAVGDATLSAIGILLRSQLRSYDVLARYGGDEFGSICCGCRPGEIDIPINRIQKSLRNGFKQTAIALPPITLSIGAVVIHELKSSISIDDLVELADVSLYKAKENGRNCAFKMELGTETDHQDPQRIELDLSDRKVNSQANANPVAPTVATSISQAIPSIAPIISS